MPNDERGSSEVPPSHSPNPEMSIIASALAHHEELGLDDAQFSALSKLFWDRSKQTSAVDTISALASTLSSNQLCRAVALITSQLGTTPNQAVPPDAMIEKLVAEALERKVKDKQLVELELATNVAERVMGWAKVFGFFMAAPVALGLVLLSAIGISKFEDLQKATSTVEARVAQAETRFDTAQRKADEIVARADQLSGVAEQQLSSIRSKLEEQTTKIATLDTRVTDIEQKRVALVIGNDNYKGANRGNSRRDAQLIGASLTKLGFELVGYNPQANLTEPQTHEMIDAFSILAKDADIALFYFSGLGIQVDDTNYLISVDVTDVEFASHASRPSHALNVDLLVKVMDKSGARAKIVLLDTDGLAPVRTAAGPGTIISLSTQPYGKAWEVPPGGVSPYAKALSDFMKVKGLQFYAMLSEVGRAVMVATHDSQQPWLTGTGMDEGIYLNPPDLMSPVPKVSDTQPPQGVKNRTSRTRGGR